MKLANRIIIFFLAAISVFSMSSCSAIEGIFKAGVWVGVVVVVAIVVLILWLIGKARK